MSLIKFVSGLLFRSHNIEERSLFDCDHTASSVVLPWCYLLAWAASTLLTNLSLLVW